MLYNHGANNFVEQLQYSRKLNYITMLLTLYLNGHNRCNSKSAHGICPFISEISLAFVRVDEKERSYSVTTLLVHK